MKKNTSKNETNIETNNQKEPIPIHSDGRVDWDQLFAACTLPFETANRTESPNAIPEEPLIQQSALASDLVLTNHTGENAEIRILAQNGGAL